MTDEETLDWASSFGLTLVSSLVSHRAYLVPVALADDRPALAAWFETEDSFPAGDSEP
jgi:hypothetical protein